MSIVKLFINRLILNLLPIKRLSEKKVWFLNFRKSIKKIAAEQLNNIELITANLESIDFKTEQFDVIFCCSAITYISDIPAILNKCYCWLKKEGYLAFTTPYKTAYMAEIKVKICQDLWGIDLPHINKPLWSIEKCRFLLQQSGFKDIEIKLQSFTFLLTNK